MRTYILQLSPLQFCRRRTEPEDPAHSCDTNKVYMQGLSHRTWLTHAVLDKSPYWCRAWSGYVSRYVGSCVPALRKWLVVTTAAYFL